MSEALVPNVPKKGWQGGTDYTGIQVMEELLYAKDALQDEVTFASSGKLVSIMPCLGPVPGKRGHGAHELASEPYVQSCSETEQDVHGLLPSHLTVEHDQYPVLTGDSTPDASTSRRGLQR